jgi:hypothetical protein
LGESQECLKVKAGAEVHANIEKSLERAKVKKNSRGSHPTLDYFLGFIY